jgi:hypothetical protein
MISSSSRNVTATPSSAPPAATRRQPGSPRGQTSTVSAAMTRNTVQVSVSTYCSRTSCSGSNSTGTAAAAATQVLAPYRTSTAYTSPAVASPTRCWISGMSHRACSRITGMIRTE